MSCNIRIIGIKGSQSCKAIVDGTSLRRYAGNKHRTDALINYGLTGQKLRNFYSRLPSARDIPMINRSVGHSKLKAVNMVKRHGILVPDSRLELNRSDKLSNWIEKRFNSQSGYGICKARGRRKLAKKYYQRFVKDRKYELRVHGFQWIDPKRWRVQKRYGKQGEIAWNFRNGGHFSTVHNTDQPTFRKAIKMTGEALGILGMGFGAADFIVDRNGDIYFIEVNSCPGFQELSKGIYIDAFEKLKSMSLKQVLKYAR